MGFSLLEEFVITELFTVLMVFARVGAGLSLMPGIGERYVAMRSRLLLAFALSVVLAPVMGQHMPPIPTAVPELVKLLAGEMLIGFMLGTIARFLVSIMHIMGMIISMNAGLAMASQFDPTQAAQGSILGNLFSLGAVVLIFALNLHYLMLQGVADSYLLFFPGDFPPIQDFANYLAKLLSGIFATGLKFAMPNIIVSMMIYLSAGILSRLMPNLQVFFLMLPIQMMVAFFILMSLVSTIMLYFIEYFEATFTGFLTPL